MSTYLNPGRPQPAPAADGLDAPFWKGLAEDQLVLQRCKTCREWQWGAEWICHHCLGFDLGFEQAEPKGLIYSFERVWHPVHPALAEQGPYLVVLVELPGAGNVRLVGNLLGDAQQEVTIGQAVTGVFEHHTDAEQPPATENN